MGSDILWDHSYYGHGRPILATVWIVTGPDDTVFVFSTEDRARAYFRKARGDDPQRLALARMIDKYTMQIGDERYFMWPQKVDADDNL